MRKGNEMASVNKVILLGNLGRDPETRYTTDNSLQITTLALATTTYRRSQDGGKTEEVEWHRVVLFGRQAEIAQQYLRKGSPVYIEGRLRTRRWEKEGQTHYSTEIIADSLQLLGSRNAQSEPSGEFENASAYRGAPAGSNSSYSRSRPSSADEFESPRTPRAPSAPAAPAAPIGRPAEMDDLDDDVPF